MGLYVAIIAQAVYDLAIFNRTGRYKVSIKGKTKNPEMANLDEIDHAHDVLYGKDWREIMLTFGIEQSALRRVVDMLANPRITPEKQMSNYKERVIRGITRELSSENYEETEKDHLTALV
jgi:hypothetical protein